MIAWEKWFNGETPESKGEKGDHLIGDCYVGSADLFSSANGENRSFLSHPTLISKNPDICRDYFDDFHHFNKDIKKFPEELHYIFDE
ncbi:MAG: hypothetical protein LKF06_06370 [Prevotella sp.]|jgi:hypothetical protein|nr:hypothetical protein [Prevotella sp.]